MAQSVQHSVAHLRDAGAGLAPLVNVTEVISPYGDGARFAVALLREVRGIVLHDPASDVSHVGFYALASQSVWLVVVATVFGVSVFCLFYWWRVYARRAT